MPPPGTLYASDHSTCSRRVLAVLREVGADYRFAHVDLAKGEQKDPATRNMLMAAIQKSILFSGMSDAQKDMIIDVSGAASTQAKRSEASIHPATHTSLHLTPHR